MITKFLERCEKERVDLPENPYDMLQEMSSALKQTQGMEKEAVDMLKQRLTHGSKRDKPEHDKEAHKDMPPHKRARLLDEARATPVVVKENQKIVDAFIDYAQQQLDRGHTGKFVSHIRAANYIRAYDKEIKNGWDAKHVGYIGDKMAGQVEEVLRTGKFKDENPDMNVTRDYDHTVPIIVTKIRGTPSKRPENQKIVDALADFGEYHLKYGNTGKGTSHLRAANQIHDADVVVTSGFRAASTIGYIGSHVADKIDQILEHGKILHDEDYTGPHRLASEPAPIVKDLMDTPAKVHENQKIVDALRDYGDAHLRVGSRGKGISHLRAAVEIRNSNVHIKTAADAQQIAMVGKKVARKIAQILHHGHADSDDDYDEAEEEDEEEEEETVEDNEQHYGTPHKSSHPTALSQDVRNRTAKRSENQKIIDALADYGEGRLSEGDRGRGVTYLRAARQLLDCGEVITTGMQAKKVGMVGDKVANFIEETLKK